jgi:hypothetical protein
MGVLNAMGVTARQERVAQIIRRAAQKVDFLFLSEVANVRVAVVLGETWDVVQFGDLGSPESGCALAVRRTRGGLSGARLHFGSPEGFKLRTRWFPTAVLTVDKATPHVWEDTVAAVHAPPMKNWSLWPGYMTRVARVKAGFRGGDWNKLLRAVSAVLPKRARFVHIIGVVHRWVVPSTAPRKYDVGSDHPLVVIDVWPEND